jgi:hypothetical protein
MKITIEKFPFKNFYAAKIDDKLVYVDNKTEALANATATLIAATFPPETINTITKAAEQRAALLLASSA